MIEAVMPYADLNGLRLYYERHGNAGDPLVLVHGFTGDVTDWRHQVAGFSPTQQVLIFDLRGHGRSDAPSDRSAYSITQFVDDVQALIAHLGFDRYHLVGHSMGGFIAQEIALTSEGRLLSLTLEDTSPGPDYRTTGALAEYERMRRAVADERGMTAVAKLPGFAPTPPYTTKERTEETRVRLASMSVDAFIGSSDAIDTWRGAVNRLRGLQVPTMVIYGALDVRVGDEPKRLAAAIRGAQLVCIPDAGHSPQYERPDLFNAALRPHLERNAAQ